MLALALAAMLVLADAASPVAEADAPATTHVVPTVRRIVLPAGAEIDLVLDETVSTKTHVKGDRLRLRVSRDVSAEGVTVIKAGSEAVGELTRSDPKGAFGAGGKLEARLLYTVVDGGSVRLEGAITARGDKATTETVLATIAVGSLSFAVTGKSAVIEKGAPVMSRLARPVEITVAR